MSGPGRATRAKSDLHYWHTQSCMNDMGEHSIYFVRSGATFDWPTNNLLAITGHSCDRTDETFVVEGWQRVASQQVDF